MKMPRERYLTDNTFKTLVDVMVAHIQECHFTPSEMRDAAILASIMYEERSIRKIIVPKIPEVIEECLDALHEWEKKWLKDGKIE
jgi:hypothetical protein